MPRLKEEFINEVIIEKSRFITYLNRALNETEAKNYINEIKKSIRMLPIIVVLLFMGNMMNFRKAVMMVNQAEQPEYQCLKVYVKTICRIV